MSYQTCPECGGCVIGAWRKENDGGYYHDRCLEVKRDRMRDAAPDMAEALQLVMAWIDAWNPGFTEDPAWEKADSKARAALAKAGLE